MGRFSKKGAMRKKDDDSSFYVKELAICTEHQGKKASKFLREHIACTGPA